MRSGIQTFLDTCGLSSSMSLSLLVLVSGALRNRLVLMAVGRLHG